MGSRANTMAISRQQPVVPLVQNYADSPLLPIEDYWLPKPPPLELTPSSNLHFDLKPLPPTKAPTTRKQAPFLDLQPPSAMKAVKFATNGSNRPAASSPEYDMESPVLGNYITPNIESLPTSSTPSLISSPSTPTTTSYSTSPALQAMLFLDQQLEGFDPTTTTPPSTLTQEEAEREDIEAAEQAEGSIVVDNFETVSDGGYQSDSNNSSASTSLSPSVVDYAFENGRRYHRFREGRYNFPNDDIEQEREDMKHAMVKMLCQQLHFAPIGDHPQQILDIGTGTGIWAMEMGERFPSANILGVDLSPIQPEWVPPNVRFLVDDIESPWLFQRNRFDYIHSRHTVMAIRDWPKLFRRALEHLRPGGWIELQEIHHVPLSATNSLPPNHPVAQYWSLINQGLSALDVDFHAAAGGRLAQVMRDCGFASVTERIFHVPIGAWPKNRVLKNVGNYWKSILVDGVQAIALGPLTRGCGWSREEVELFLVQVRSGYEDTARAMYMPMHVIYAQKPMGF